MVKSFVFFCTEAAAAEEGRCGAALAPCDREQGNWGQERLTRRPPAVTCPPSLTITCVLTQVHWHLGTQERQGCSGPVHMHRPNSVQIK